MKDNALKIFVFKISVNHSFSTLLQCLSDIYITQSCLVGHVVYKPLCKPILLYYQLQHLYNVVLLEATRQHGNSSSCRFCAVLLIAGLRYELLRPPSDTWLSVANPNIDAVLFQNAARGQRTSTCQVYISCRVIKPRTGPSPGLLASATATNTFVVGQSSPNDGSSRQLIAL